MKHLPSILMYDTKPYDREFFESVNQRYGFTIKYLSDRLTDDNAILAKGYDAVCLFVNDYVTPKVAEVFASAGVKLIALRCAGYNNIDLPSVYGKIHVVRVPAYSPHAVAEHTVALLLALNRKVHRAYWRTREFNFSLTGLMGFDLHGKTAGIIGTGQIGRLVAQILGDGFGMRILLHDPYPAGEWAASHRFSYVPLETLYRESDVISLHCPLTPQTIHLINDESLSLMKKGVFIVNTGRGKLIDTKALIQALKRGHIGAAGLDVYEEETEYFFEDHSDTHIQDDVLARLLTFPNVLVTSHQAFFTREALTNIAETTLKNIDDFFSGRSLENEICYQCDMASCRKKETGRCF
ncbi:D-isomer specific 2-hydroxyacid dehydrogenase NAD-binding protein [Spirochaeta thermophila DSM 6578]|uniref:D-isomer specific 2-hydroxyacid dehydrogenase NAD-binding protein n=1 Tax=Winmispira thermophila (strain ATCC 700085 / DSM 6578 / Z-1203) TaxID=869211 RepID=G0G9V9_WINT7|nr:2-hydroxyacid dehydrogenase [Spirochaeta thermophila]AEJ60859.1 D-isomer specific 2-hydroxyacid dehydrogenase NAD-binding protein [Spirochaeta thermophila DSM 6578]